MRYLTLLIFVIAIGQAAAQTSRVETFQVRSQPAAALVGTVRPLLGEGGGVSAYGDRLIVRGSEQEIAAVRALLGEIDRPPRRLIIEVRQRGSLSLSTQGIGYGVDTGHVRLGQAPPEGGGRIVYRGAETRGRDDSLQRVQALEGRPALIRAGQAVPVYQAHQQVFGNAIVQGYQVQFRNTGSGFVALPRVHGEQVTVEIYQRHERPAQGGRFDTQQASTVLRGALGQWLTLGAVGDTDSDQQDGLGRHVQTRRATDRQLQLRVIPID